MKASIRLKLEKAEERLDELRHLLASPETIENVQQFRDLSVEYARLEPTAIAFASYRRLEQELTSAEEMLDDQDSDIRALGAEEARLVRRSLEQSDRELQSLLLPRDDRDERNIYLEIRAGTGGDEAAIFAGDLLRMYSRYAESQGWQIETLSENSGEHGGYREVICRVVGRSVFSRLKFESGTHRVQRVPATEAQGRIHTSTVTVAILPELEEIDKVQINPAEIRVDTYRASGAGGQHVNKTDSAIRITHLPSGIVVECQDERSQHKNRSRAMSLLAARLTAAEQEKQLSAQARARKLQVGTAERSERIRTYNFRDGRVTDHRIDLTLYRLPEIMQGQIDELLSALQNEYQAELLADAE
jgi:peptide chain release factor 1